MVQTMQQHMYNYNKPAPQPLDMQQKINLYNAMNSMDKTTDGINLDDFMASMQKLAAWHTSGRAENDLVINA